MFARLIKCWAALLLTAASQMSYASAAEEIPAELIPGVTGHPQYMTHSYSMPLTVRDGHLFLVYLEDDPQTSSSIIHRPGPGAAWTHPVRLGGGHRYDGHYYPNLVIDKQGLLHVFYGCHGDPLRYRRSRRPLDSSAWEAETTPLKVATYPRPFVLGTGELVVFSRTQTNYDPRYGYILSRDGGNSWSEFHTLIYGPGRLWSPYVGGVTIEEDGVGPPTIHLAWSWYNQAERPQPFYYDDAMYAACELGSRHWRRADKSLHPLPATYQSAVPIRRQQKFYVDDFTIDSRGRPLVLISQYGLSDQERRNSKTLLATYDGQAWQVSEPLPGIVFPVGGMRILQVRDWTAIVGYTASDGLVIAQRKDRASDFLVRPIQPVAGLIPVHPVIATDEQGTTFHVVATGYRADQPGCLIYASASVDP